MWEQSPDAMAVALRRHDELVDRAVAAQGGTVVKHRGEGDSTFCVLPDVTSAVKAAVTLQLWLTEEDWPPPCQVRVRAGIHSGTAEERHGDLYGPEINRAARLRSLARGGQILLSAAAATAVASDLPVGFELRDHGLQRLRGSSRPERTFQLVGGGLTDDRLAIASSGSSSLPRQTTSFVGREREIEIVQTLLSSHRMVTITGPGGAGKTRLAIRAAEMVEAGFDDGVWMADLSPISNLDQVATALATGLQMPVETGSPTLDVIAAYIGERHLLLLIDNCEQVIEGVVAALAELLRRCGRLHVLATSRERMRLESEAVVSILPLAAPDSGSLTAAEVLQSPAAWLFCDRASAADPNFRLDDSLAPVISSICRQLDGLPLALELAAAELRMLTPEQLLGRWNIDCPYPAHIAACPRANRLSTRWSAGATAC